jgi:hypothetical protein
LVGRTELIAAGRGANSADDANGGGIVSLVSPTVMVVNTTFAQNHADGAGSGGGIRAENGSMTVNDSTFWDNAATTGGGIDNGGATVTLKATILGNTAVGGDCGGTGTPPVTDGGYNLADDGSCGFTSAQHSYSNTPAGLEPEGPTANGGPTLVVELEPGSVAIDVVPKLFLPSKVDQRGYTRPDNSETKGDIGAYELRDGCDSMAV